MLMTLAAAIPDKSTDRAPQRLNDARANAHAMPQLTLGSTLRLLKDLLFRVRV